MLDLQDIREIRNVDRTRSGLTQAPGSSSTLCLTSVELVGSAAGVCQTEGLFGSVGSFKRPELKQKPQRNIA